MAELQRFRIKMKQEKNNYCLCSVLQDILFYEKKIKISQDEIAKRLTPAEKGFKADDENIKKFMKEQGFDYQFYWYIGPQWPNWQMSQNEDYSPLFPAHSVIFQAVVVDNQVFLG